MTRFGPLYDIDHPAVLAGYIVAAAVGLIVRGVVQARLSALLGDDTGLRQGRAIPDLRQHVEVHSVVAWALGGFAWGTPSLFGWRSVKRTRIVTALAGPITLFCLVLGWYAIYRSIGDPTSHAADFCGYAAATTAGMTVLSCVPVPPLDGWTFFRAVAKPSPGLERARYQLEERNLGLAIAFGMVVLPRLFVSLPDPLVSLADRLLDLARTITGG